MENQFDSESYWNRSTSKAFSFDDDEDASSPSNFLNLPGTARDGGGGGVLNEDTISEASFDNSAAGSALNLSIKSVISEEALKEILEQTLDDRVISRSVLPEEELRLLRRQIQTTLYAPSPEATAHKLLLGKSVPLEVFKSLHEKQQLLDAVLRCGGGDAVVHVLLFLQRTLKRTHFHAILQQRPRALQQYISFLKQRHASDDNDEDDRNEADELLQLFGQQQEAALLQFQAAFLCGTLQERKQMLCQLLERRALQLPTVYQQLFNASFKLLELIEKERDALDNRVGLNSTPIEVLHACCHKHGNWKEQDLQRATSPFRLAVEQLISPAQFEWVALNERAAAQSYADLESVFERVPAWHPMKQRQFHISFSLELAVLRLHELQAPASVLYLFLSRMGNSSEKLALAQRVKSPKGVIDALVGLKELTQLTQLRETLPERSEEQFYCDKAIKTMQGKRWSTDNINIKLKL